MEIDTEMNGNPKLDKIITIHEDSMHGWAKVLLSELIELSILDRISECSYTDETYAYLEEDRDLSIYCRVLEQKGIEFQFKSKDDGNRSKIRSLERFSHNLSSNPNNLPTQ